MRDFFVVARRSSGAATLRPAPHRLGACSAWRDAGGAMGAASSKEPEASASPGAGAAGGAPAAPAAPDAMPHRVASAEISHPPEVSPSVARANQELMRQLMPPGTAEAGETKTKAKDEVGVAK